MSRLVRQRKKWTIGFAVTIIIVAIALYYMSTQKLELSLPEFTVETILIMAVFSFPASYTGRWTADHVMNQSIHIGDVFKETVVGVSVHWSIYLPMLMIYNYVVFGRLLSIPSIHLSINPFGFTIPILLFVSQAIVYPILYKMEKKKDKWYSNVKVENMEEV